MSDACLLSLTSNGHESKVEMKRSTDSCTETNLKERESSEADTTDT